MPLSCNNIYIISAGSYYYPNAGTRDWQDVTAFDATAENEQKAINRFKEFCEEDHNFDWAMLVRITPEGEYSTIKTWDKDN